MELKFSQRGFEKCSNILFRSNPPVRTELLQAEGRTDRHDEAHSGFPYFFFESS